MKQIVIIYVSFLCMGVLWAGDASISLNKKNSMHKTEGIAKVLAIEPQNNNQFYIAGLGGFAKTNVESILEVGKSFIPGTLNDKGSLYEIEMGYIYNKNYLLTLSMQQAKYDISKINNIMVGVNYQFSDLFLHPYIGAIAGYSELKWSQRPHVMEINEKLKSSSLLYGLQIGIEKSVVNNIFLYSKYEWIKYGHTMEIRNKNSLVEHTNQQNLLIGVKYVF